ncbi:type II toxin-antitoxin system RelE family toxin [Pseudomonas sp. EL_65y_Pfl2_R95]|uniref:type II toxin-antitoxin system RelE family toxin n=1 Tax=Pseudomonas sp. EL_65y_Pfl2_R95 TaxID=3088698 RepID=UPI0030D89738
MIWKVTYHEAVTQDFDRLGRAEARRVLRVVEERIINGEPDKSGKALRGLLAGCRRIRTGDLRIVYRIKGTELVLLLCVGPRRDDEVYDIVKSRV